MQRYNASKMVFGAAVCFVAAIAGTGHALAAVLIGIACLVLAGAFAAAARH